MLQRTNQAITALKMLREKEDKFDLVISEVHMPDMDGFKLLELVGLEMDLPVIICIQSKREMDFDGSMFDVQRVTYHYSLDVDKMSLVLSADSDTKAVLKGITHGACAYLLKPVRIEELKNIWQNVVRRRKINSN